MKKAKILCVIDAQNDFIDGVLGTKEAVEAVPAIVEKIKNWDGVVFYTKDTHDDKYPETLEGRKLPTAHCKKGTEGRKLNKDILAVIDEAMTYPCIEKSTFGTFALVDAIKKHCKQFGIDNEEKLEITLIGFCTDICVVSNAILLKASFPESEISVDSTACAGTNPSFHKAALVTMKSCQINIL